MRLRGLTIGPPSYVAPGIRVSDCAGLLWIEDCTLVGHDGFKLVGPITFPGLPGLVVADSDAVVVVRSVTVGGNGPNPPIDGGFGVRVLTSHVALYECVVSGGDGGTGQGGGDALSAENADLVFVDCSVVGGLGGDGCTSVVPGPCRGGDGLVLEGGVTLFHLDTTIAGGLGGTLIGGGSALPGDPQVVTPDDAVEAWPGTGRSLTVDSPVREGELATLRFEGEPGDTVGVFAALTPGYALMPGNLGVFTLGPPLTGPILLRTVTSPDGTLEVPFRAWPLGAAGLEAGDVFGQGFVLTAGGSVQVSGPTMLTVLDGSL